MKGKHIVNENLRQLCIFNMTAGVNRDKATSMWWDYIDFFNLNCNNKNPQYSVTCSETQMKSTGYTQNDIDNVRKCTGTLYDYTDKGGVKRNFLLDQEVRQQREDNIFTIPTIIISNEPYRGGYTCPHPPQLASCGVLSAVCSAFVDGLEPPACKSDYCWNQLDDCGTCLAAKDFKTQKNLKCCEMTPGKRFDSCGNCKNITAPDFNQCYQAGMTQVTTGVVGGVVAVFIVLLLVIAGVVAAAVILLKKKDQETRRYVDSVVSSYLPMEDNNDDEEDETASLNKKVEQEATL